MSTVSKKPSKHRGKKQSSKKLHMEEEEANPENVNDCESILFLAIKSNTASLVVTVADWLKDYKEDKSTAFLQLAQMIFNCCGCNKEITMDMLSQNDAAHVVNSMSVGFTLGPDNMYPMINPGNRGKKFCNLVCDFFQEIVTQTKNSLFFDGFLMCKLTDLLACLSASGIRAFRHTSTFIGLKLQTAIVEVYVELLQRKSITLKQLEAVQTKDNLATLGQIEALQARLAEYKENEPEIAKTIRLLTLTCFIPRIRDVMPEIRTLAMSELCVWLLRHPEYFDGMIKYVRYGLFDPHAQVRLSAIQSLKQLVEQDNLQILLSPLLNIIKQRLVDLTIVKDLNAAILAMDVLTTIKKSHSKTVPLTVDDCTSVCRCMYSRHRVLARAAGNFFVVCHRVFQREESETDDDEEKSDSDADESSASQAKTFFRDLISFHLHCKLEDPITISLLVDALTGHVPYLTSWKTMTELLMQVCMTDSEQYVFVNLLVHSVQQAITGELPAECQQSKKALTTRELKKFELEKAHMTEYFIGSLPCLLKIHQGDSQKLTHLLSIVLKIDINMYTTLHKENAIKSLLKVITRMVVSTSYEAELQMCAKVFLYFQSLEHQYVIHYTELIKNGLMPPFVEAYEDWKNKAENATEEEADRVTACICRIAIMSSAFCLFKENDYLYFEEILQDAVQVGSFASETYMYAIQAYYFCLQYSLRTDETFLLDIAEPSQRFISVLRPFLNPATDVQLKTMAYNAACDILLLNQVRDNSMGFFRFISRLGNILKEIMMTPTKYEPKDWSKRKLLITFWRLLLNSIIPPSFAYYYFENFLKMNEVYTESIGDMFTSLWKSDMTFCAQLVISGLKALFERYYEVDKIDRLSAEFKNIMEVTRHTVGWLNVNSNNAERFSAQLLQILRNELPLDMEEGSLPFFEMMAQFSTKLINKDKAKLLQEVRATLPEKSEVSVQVFVNSLCGSNMPGFGTKRTLLKNHAAATSASVPEKTRRMEPLKVILTRHQVKHKQAAPSPAPFTSALVDHSSTPKPPQASSSQLHIEPGDLSRLSSMKIGTSLKQQNKPKQVTEEPMDFEAHLSPLDTFNVNLWENDNLSDAGDQLASYTQNKEGTVLLNELLSKQMDKSDEITQNTKRSEVGPSSTDCLNATYPNDKNTEALFEDFTSNSFSTVCSAYIEDGFLNQQNGKKINSDTSAGIQTVSTNNSKIKLSQGKSNVSKSMTIVEDTFEQITGSSVNVDLICATRTNKLDDILNTKLNENSICFDGNTPTQINIAAGSSSPVASESSLNSVTASVYMKSICSEVTTIEAEESDYSGEFSLRRVQSVCSLSSNNLSEILSQENDDCLEITTKNLSESNVCLKKSILTAKTDIADVPIESFGTNVPTRSHTASPNSLREFLAEKSEDTLTNKFGCMPVISQKEQKHNKDKARLKKTRKVVHSNHSEDSPNRNLRARSRFISSRKLNTILGEQFDDKLTNDSGSVSDIAQKEFLSQGQTTKQKKGKTQVMETVAIIVGNKTNHSDHSHNSSVRNTRSVSSSNLNEILEQDKNKSNSSVSQPCSISSSVVKEICSSIRGSKKISQKAMSSIGISNVGEITNKVEGATIPTDSSVKSSYSVCSVSSICLKEILTSEKLKSSTNSNSVPSSLSAHTDGEFYNATSNIAEIGINTSSMRRAESVTSIVELEDRSDSSETSQVFTHMEHANLTNDIPNNDIRTPSNYQKIKFSNFSQNKYPSTVKNNSCLESTAFEVDTDDSLPSDLQNRNDDNWSLSSREICVLHEVSVEKHTVGHQNNTDTDNAVDQSKMYSTTKQGYASCSQGNAHENSILLEQSEDNIITQINLDSDSVDEDFQRLYDAVLNDCSEKDDTICEDSCIKVSNSNLLTAQDNSLLKRSSNFRESPNIVSVDDPMDTISVKSIEFENDATAIQKEIFNLSSFSNSESPVSKKVQSENISIHCDHFALLEQLADKAADSDSDTSVILLDHEPIKDIQIVDCSDNLESKHEQDDNNNNNNEYSCKNMNYLSSSHRTASTKFPNARTLVQIEEDFQSFASSSSLNPPTPLSGDERCASPVLSVSTIASVAVHTKKQNKKGKKRPMKKQIHTSEKEKEVQISHSIEKDSDVTDDSNLDLEIMFK